MPSRPSREGPRQDTGPRRRRHSSFYESPDRSVSPSRASRGRRETVDREARHVVFESPQDIDRRRRSSSSSSSSSPAQSRSPSRLYNSEAPSFRRPKGSLDLSEVAPTVYAFTPSRLLRSKLGSRTSDETEVDLSSEEEADDGPTEPLQEAYHTPTVPTTYVFESRYTGDGFPNGIHNAQLNTSTTRSRAQPMFRWAHLTRSSMDFVEFSTSADQMPGLSKAERKGVAELLARVRRKHVKSITTSSGRYVQHMEPSCAEHILPSSSGSGRSIAPRTITWICLPYFSLEKYSGLDAPDKAAFPIHTLLQTHFSQATKQRDMLQAVARLHLAPTGMCFHIPQIWSLIIGNSLLLTCSRMSLDALCGDSISLNINPATQESPQDPQKPKIQVCYGNSVVWALAVEDCQTWMDFTCHFLGFWPQSLTFLRHKRPVKAAQWPRIWHMAKHIQVILELELSAPTFDTLPSGILAPLGETQLTTNESSHIPTATETQTETKDASSGPERTQSSKLGGMQSTSVTDDSGSTGDAAIFNCLECVADSTTNLLHVNRVPLGDHFMDVEDFLLHKTSFTDRRVYKIFSTSTRAIVHGLLEKHAAKLLVSPDETKRDIDQAAQRLVEAKIDLFNVVDQLFRFFFPLSADVATVGKFWGAIKRIVELNDNMDDKARGRERMSAGNTLTALRGELELFLPIVTSFNQVFGSAKASDRLKTKVPDTLIQAWIHLLMGLIYATNDYVREQLFETARQLIEKGATVIIESLAKKKPSLLDQSTVLPQELFSLISLRLLQDVTAGSPDIDRTYSTYLNSLGSNSATKPSNRSLEYRIGMLNQELSIVRGIVKSQRRVFDTLGWHQGTTAARFGQRAASKGLKPNNKYYPEDNRGGYYGRRAAAPWHTKEEGGRYDEANRGASPERSYYGVSRPHEASRAVAVGLYDTRGSDDTAGFKLSSTDPGGFRQLFLQDCVHHLDRRERDFEQYSSHADWLETENRNKLDTTKDRQERAIYAFTIVTVIFLPLSFVSSIFGMNTSDIRDMEFDQRIYWASAIPLTAAVIFCGLLWTGELGRILRWMIRLGPWARDHRGGYQPMDGDYAQSLPAHTYNERSTVPRPSMGYMEYG